VPTILSMRVSIAILTTTLLLACESSSSENNKEWGDVCVADYKGRFSYDINTQEQSCVTLINQYRSEMGQPPLSRWSDGESCAESEASKDAAANDAHGAFGECGEMAQNTCPGWGSVDSVLGGCLLSMFCEGPSPSGNWDAAHGHHMNMVNSGYTKVACGFYAMSDGSYWVNMNFK
jgi:uncharacterized protein YkwD